MLYSHHTRPKEGEQLDINKQKLLEMIRSALVNDPAPPLGAPDPWLMNISFLSLIICYIMLQYVY